MEEGFVRFLIPYYTRFNKIEAPFEIQKFVQEIERGEPDAFFRRLQSFFADTPYELVKELELHYQNVLFIVFKLVGFYVKAEYHTSQGRIDLGAANRQVRLCNGIQTERHCGRGFAAD